MRESTESGRLPTARGTGEEEDGVTGVLCVCVKCVCVCVCSSVCMYECTCVLMRTSVLLGHTSDRYTNNVPEIKQTPAIVELQLFSSCAQQDQPGEIEKNTINKYIHQPCIRD